MKKSLSSPLPTPPATTAALGETAPPSAYSDSLASLQAETTMILQQFGGGRSTKNMGKTATKKDAKAKAKTGTMRRKERRNRKRGALGGKKVKVKRSYRNKAVENVPESIQAAHTVFPRAEGGADGIGEASQTRRNFLHTVEVLDDGDDSMYDSDDSAAEREEFERAAKESNARLERIRDEEREMKDLTFKSEEVRGEGGTHLGRA
ncbi:hypothetical protein TrRE_jg11603 [Triparma retinervis]|uniref:Uncharacterized protein n=1 Tax=Triparma retinervis TaxID=2557542 RepID=A0A9W7CG06_9STRA|nr:hypothetical protein TrRE_jg11603 [Triparma retinervis]